MIIIIIIRVKIKYADPEKASTSEFVNFNDINLTLDFPRDTLEEVSLPSSFLSFIMTVYYCHYQISMLPELIGSFDLLPSKAFKGIIIIIDHRSLSSSIIIITIIKVKQTTC